MFPDLFKIGPLALHTYGLMLILGFLLGIKVTERRARGTEIHHSFFWDLAVWVIVSGIAGARALYVILNFDEYRGRPLSIISPFQADGSLGIGGLVFMGGLITASLTTILYTRWRGYSVFQALDLIMPGAALGYGVGRLGCFFAGCCYGLPTKLPWGLHFPADCPAGLYQKAVGASLLHPTQLYMTLGAILVGVLLIVLERWKKFDGHTFLLFVMFYAVDRSIVDHFRYYPANELHHGLTHNQILLGTAFTVSLVAFIVLRIRAGRTPAP